jgi:hypothetical protein
MEISVILNAHGDTPVVTDTIEAVQRWVTSNTLVVVDGASKDWYKEDIPAHKLSGFWHNCPKSPYRNITLGLMEAYKKWPNSDWYCYMEYDVLFTSDNFKRHLLSVDEDVWCIGNDSRHIQDKYDLSPIEKISNMKFNCNKYLLGCCIFYKGTFIKRLQEINFFEKFLYYTNDFSNGFFPNYKGYDLAEHLYPTLAHHMGGKVAHFANWNQKKEEWEGNYKQYPMRWKPELEISENFEEANIMHPLKSVDHPIRQYHKKKREVS